MPLRIGFVSQWYDPEGGSAAVPGTISRALQARGHDVQVLTGFPNYPTGRLADGYRLRPYQRERRGQITVHRAPLYPSHDTHPVRRAANYLSFATAASAVGLARLGRLDAMLVHSTPATVALPAMAMKALRRTPYVVHIQDLWPQTVTSSGFLRQGGGGRVERALHVYCDAVYRRAAVVAVTSPGMADLIASRGIDERKISLVPNWANEEAFRPAPRDEALAAALGLSRPFTLMYAGNFGEFQALDVVVEVATLLRHRTDIGFTLVGGGVAEAKLRSMVAERSLDNVQFVPPQPFDRMADILALGDVQLVSLQDLPLFRSTLPSKLQATLAAGQPIIGALAGDAAELVAKSGAGLVVTPGSAEELADAVLRARAMPAEDLRAWGSSGRDHYLEHLSERVVGDHLSGLLQRASESKGRLDG